MQNDCNREEKAKQAIKESRANLAEGKSNQDYSENHILSLDFCRESLLDLAADYCESNRQQLLPQISRLIATYSKLSSREQPRLKDIINEGNTLDKALAIMKVITNVKLYFLIGCYLLGQAKKRSWDIDALISALEKKCKGHLLSIFDYNDPMMSIIPDRFDISHADVFSKEEMGMYLSERESNAYCEFKNSRVLPIYEDAISYMHVREQELGDISSALSIHELLFLGYGPLASALSDLSEKQLGRLLRIIPNKNEREFILDTISARLAKNELNNALVHMEKLRHYAGFQFTEAEFEEPDNKKLFDVLYQDFIDKLLCFGRRSFGGYTAEEAMADSEDSLDTPAALLLADKEYRIGRMDKAIEILRKHEQCCGDYSMAFAAELCRFGDTSEGYRLFEDEISAQEEKHSLNLKALPDASVRLVTLATAGMWDEILSLASQNPEIFRDMPMKEFASLLTHFMGMKQHHLVAELMHLRNAGIEALCEAPELFGILRQLKEKGEWDDVPGVTELSQWIQHKGLVFIDGECPEFKLLNAIFGGSSMPYGDASKIILKPGVPQDMQLEFIKKAFCAFRKTIGKESETKPNDFYDSIKIMVDILSQNSAELGNQLYPYVNELLKYTQKLDVESVADLELLAPDNENARMPFKNMLLHDTLPKEHIHRCVNNMPAYMSDRLYCYIFYGMLSEAKEYIASKKIDDSEKKKEIVSCVSQVLRYHTNRKLCDKNYDWRIPQDYVELMRWAFGLSAENLKHFHTCLAPLYFFRGQENARKIGEFFYNDSWAWNARTPVSFSAKETYDLIWAIGWEKFCNDVHSCYDFKVFADYLEQLDELPDNWFETAQSLLPTSRNEYDLYDDSHGALCKLFRLTLLKGTIEQSNRVLAKIDVNMLVSNCIMLKGSKDYADLDLVKLCHVLHDAGWSNVDIHSVMIKQNWKSLPYRDLCALAPCMMNDWEFIQLWLKRSLQRINDSSPKICQECISSCPELFWGKAVNQE